MLLLHQQLRIGFSGDSDATAMADGGGEEQRQRAEIGEA
jgi:hypothetical protein